MWIPTLLLALVLLMSACIKPTESAPEATGDAAQEIVDKSIAAHGGELFERATIEFDFRGRHYRLERQGERFVYERLTGGEQGKVLDRLDNEGFTRRINDQMVAVPDSMVPRYSSSINSVAYFLVLPYRLNDASVQKRSLGFASIEGTDYHKVEVTFLQEGGGEDHEDVFVYWFDSVSGYLDYLAYAYEEEDGIGLRFRKAINPRVREGIRIQDYINYKGPAEVEVAQLDSLYKLGALEELSRIENENVKVTLSEVPQKK